jgi:hypothetical protein
MAEEMRGSDAPQQWVVRKRHTNGERSSELRSKAVLFRRTA